MTNKRLVQLIVALALVVCALFSMTSCLLNLGGIYQEILENQQNSPDNNYGDNEENKGNNPGSPELPTPDISDGESGSGQFYPGSGSEITENIPTLQQTLLSTVSIISNFSSPAAGSGVIYSIDKEKGDAYIITNFHVVYNKSSGVCNDISLYLYGMELEGYAIPAKFVGGSNSFDIAVLKVTGSEVLKNSYAMATTLGDSDAIRIFDTVYAVGNPEGYGLAATKGMVSVTSESLEIVGGKGTEISLRVIRIDAAVNAGNSGGGLYDDQGKLVGIVCAKRVGDDIDNIGYAIPSNLAKNLVENIIYHCNGSSVTQLNRAMMGVTITAKIMGLVVDPESGDLVEAEIVEVTEISEGSLAEGKVKVGDYINSITVDGVTVTVSRIHHVTDHMLNARVGSTVTMNVTRDGETMDITFTISSSNITLVD